MFTKFNFKKFLEESFDRENNNNDVDNDISKIDFCKEIKKYDKMQKLITLSLPFPGIGQHAVKGFCFFPGAFDSNFITGFESTFETKLKILSRSNFSCGYDSVLIEGIDQKQKEKSSKDDTLNNDLTFTDAQIYVSGGVSVATEKWKFSGNAQFLTLLRMGLKPHHRVLEIGCGTFNLGRYLIPYLDTQKYVCVEPNKWLIRSSLDAMDSNNNNDNDSINILFNVFTALKKKIELLHRYDFNASSVVKSNKDKFDFIYSHSVLSHASMSQLDAYVEISSRLLKPNGVSLASMCLCAPCENNDGKGEYGKHGMEMNGDENMALKCTESMDEVWIYPYVTWWSPRRLYSLGEKHNMSISWRNDIRENLMQLMESEAHDWIVMVKKN